MLHLEELGQGEDDDCGHHLGITGVEPPQEEGEEEEEKEEEGRKEE